MEFRGAGAVIIKKDNQPFCGIVHDYSNRTYDLAKMLDKLSKAVNDYRQYKGKNPCSENDWINVFLYFDGYGYAFVFDRKELETIINNSECKVVFFDFENLIVNK